MTTSSQPLVSVIIPSYNHAQWVASAIESVLNQSYQNIEIIIVDDNSSDNSKDIIRTYALRSRVKVIFKEKNSGQGDSINLAVQLSTGEFISWLPSDDYYFPDKVQKQLSLFLRLDNSYGVVYGRVLRYFMDSSRLVEQKATHYQGNIAFELATKPGFIPPISPLFRRKVLLEYPMDVRFKAEGESIFFKISQKYKFAFEDSIVGVMRGHTYNTGSNYILMYEENIRWWTYFLDDSKTCVTFKTHRNLILGRLHRMFGLSLLSETSRHTLARSALLTCLKVNPFLFFDYKVIFGILISFMNVNISRRLTAFKKRVGNKRTY